MDTVVQPVALGLATLVLAAAVSGGVTYQPVSPQNAQTPEHHYPAEERSELPLPLSGQARSRVLHRQVTKAAMTGHKLTEAHFFARHQLGKLLAGPNENLKKS